MTDTDGPRESASQAANFSVEIGATHDGYREVVVAGDIDLVTYPELTGTLSQAQQGPMSIRLDLRGVEFMGSAGLSALVEAARRADEGGVKMAVVATGRTVLRAIEVTGLDSVFHLFDSPDSAEEYLQS